MSHKKDQDTEKTGIDRWNEGVSKTSRPHGHRSDDAETSGVDASEDKAKAKARQKAKAKRARSNKAQRAKAGRAKGHRRGGRFTQEVRRYAGTLIMLAVVLVACVVMFTPLSERITQGLDIQGGVSVIMTASKADGSDVTSDDMSTATTIVTNRVNSLGASEATVQQQGTNSILVQIPGATDAQSAVDTIGRTGNLEFVKMSDIGDADALAQIQAGTENVELKQGTYSAFMTGADIDSVSVGQTSSSTSGEYAVDIKLNSEGTQLFADVTKELVSTHGQIAIVLDGVVNSAPSVQSEITGGEVQITGDYTLSEAKSLKTVLDSGSLPVTLTYSESRVVGPTLGQDSLQQGLLAIAVGGVIVIAYLFFFYKGLGLLTFGSIGVFAVVYLGILAVLSHYGAFALSLAGLAGIVLTIGMAADSSILVLERFREEICMGKSVRNASLSGVKHGIRTSVHADMVTLVSALALFFVAVGQVKGFGLTLALGIVCDIVTMYCFKAPALRLLARGTIQKHPRFWGIQEDLDEAAERAAEGEEPAAADAASEKGGVAHA
ncbi:MAG: protein translocase subunit SecD [Atopobiaceae bacterium]|nr:protein translocase subunit SecD [Atopobiaceae bacterium]